MCLKILSRTQRATEVEKCINFAILGVTTLMHSYLQHNEMRILLFCFAILGVTSILTSSTMRQKVL